MSNVSFADLGLAEPLLRALEAAGYTVPTPIQARTIPALLQGRDVLGIAQTGTGKTAAFALPILQHLSAFRERPQPKQPAGAGAGADARARRPDRPQLRHLRHAASACRLGMVIGGLGFGRQIETLNRGVDILVATPGRLLDLVERGNVKLAHVTFLVLDEADRMFDMGFIRDVRRIVASVSKQRQTLLFSATMPGDISKLASEILKNPEKVEIAPQGRTVDKVDQRVYFVTAAAKRALLSHLLNDETLERVIVFTRTKRGANRVAEALEDRGVRSEAIHGNKSQNARQKALDNFSRGQRPRAGRHRSRLARHRRHGRHPRHQLRAAGRRRELRPSHRPHRARRRLGHRAVVLRRQRARPAQEHRAADQPAHRRRPDAGQRGHAGGAAAASEGRARRARRRRAARASRQRSRSQARQWQRQRYGRGGRGGHRPFGERSRGDRPSAPAEHQWSRGDYRDAPQGERTHDDRPRTGPTQGERPHGARPHANRPYTPRPQGDRPFGGPPRGGRRFGGGGGGGRGGRGRAA